MKKVMIGILVLIPIIIILAVSLVSNFVSTYAHISVEEVRLSQSVVNIDSLPSGVYNLEDDVKVQILPVKATDKSYVWTLENVRILDGDYAQRYEKYLEEQAAYDEAYAVYRREVAVHNEWLKAKAEAEKKGEPFDEPEPSVSPEPQLPSEVVPPVVTLVDADGNATEAAGQALLRIGTYCSFDAVVTAETMSARCTVYVGGDKVTRVELSAKENSLKVGDSVMLNSVFTPIDSIVRNIKFDSDNPGVLAVDGNGVVTALSVGTARVTMSALQYADEAGSAEIWIESNEIEFTVAPAGSAFGDEVYVDKAAFTLAELGITSALASYTGCTLSPDGGTVTFLGDQAVLTLADGSVVTVSRCESDDIIIKNRDFFQYSDSEKAFVLEVGGYPLVLSVGRLSSLSDGAVEGAAWSSDNPSVARVDQNGRVTGVSGGIADITVSAGSKRATISVAVAEKITSVLLETSDASLSVGIARETVFASERYSATTGDQTEPNYLDINVKIPVPPEDEAAAARFYRAFIFSVDNEEIAYFEGNRLIFKPENITEKTVLTVTVKARYPKYASLEAYTTAVFRLKVVPGIMVYDYADFVRAAADEKIICFGANIKVVNPEGSDKGEMVTIRKNLYGNNMMLSAERGQFHISTEIIRIAASDVTVSNVIIRANEVEEEITNAEGNSGLTGYCLHAQPDNIYDHLTGVRLEYSIFENAATALGFYSTDVTMDGCIVRNTSGTGIFVKTWMGSSLEEVSYSNVTLNNIVMSNLVGTGMSFQYSGYSNSAEKAELAKQAIAAGLNTKLTQTGFLDIYNWQTLNALSLISPDQVSESDYKLIEIATSLVKSELSKTDGSGQLKYKDFIKQYNGETYFHLGFISTGIGEISYLETQFEDNRFLSLSSDELLNLGDLVKPIRLWCYSSSVDDLIPGRGYSVNKALIDRLNPAAAVKQRF